MLLLAESNPLLAVPVGLLLVALMAYVAVAAGLTLTGEMNWMEGRRCQKCGYITRWTHLCKVCPGCGFRTESPYVTLDCPKGWDEVTIRRTLPLFAWEVQND